jgi:hypothetical protein
VRPYGPELNAQERMWRGTRQPATRNRFFEEPRQLCQVLFRRLGHVQQRPEEIASLIQPVV